VESPVHVEFRFGGGRHERSLQTQILRWWEERGSENRDQGTGIRDQGDSLLGSWD
jgi:hypothetical protein